jgi:hypothetical protein
VKFNYIQELSKISADARARIRRYQDNDDLDDETYRFTLGSDTKVTERSMLKGGYEFIKDTTLDSELEETGRIFFREDRFSHEIFLTPSFNVTETTNVGISGSYRNVNYDSDSKIDYSTWAVNLPVRWRLATLVDTIYISPGYAYSDSDLSRSKTYNFWIGWDHQSTERLKVILSAGARYSEFELVDSSVEKEEKWGGLGNLRFNYDFETGGLEIGFQHDLRNTAAGEQVNVSKLLIGLRWNFTERMGMNLTGRYYYTKTEDQNNDDTTEFYLARSDLYYHLTRDHVIFMDYEYSVENQKDVTEDPRSERNRIWVGIRLSFPII